MAGLPGVEEVAGGLVADLAADDAVGGGAEGGLDEVADADGVGGVGEAIGGGALQLDGVLEDDDAVAGAGGGDLVENGVDEGVLPLAVPPATRMLRRARTAAARAWRWAGAPTTRVNDSPA